MAEPSSVYAEDATEIVVESGEIAPTIGVKLARDVEARVRFTQALLGPVDVGRVHRFLSNAGT